MNGSDFRRQEATIRAHGNLYSKYYGNIWEYLAYEWFWLSPPGGNKSAR